MTVLQEHFMLSNGVQLPKVGFGTWQIPDAQQAYDAAEASYTLDLGDDGDVTEED